MSLRWSEPFQPFLKWPGGKRWAASDIIGFARPALKGTYYEPFLGGGAVYFSLQPNKAVLGDINGKLVDTYIAVRDHIDEVIRALRRLEVSEHEYYRIRESKPIKLSRRAARFLYLNRTAFGGIYRENKQGQFNVPFGGGQRTPAILWETDLLRKASQLLSKAIIFQSDFEPLMDEAVKATLYIVIHHMLWHTIITGFYGTTSGFSIGQIKSVYHKQRIVRQDGESLLSLVMPMTNQYMHCIRAWRRRYYADFVQPAPELKDAVG